MTTAHDPTVPDPNRNIRTAGTIALWMWIIIVGVPILLVLLCIGGCLGIGLLGTVLPDPSASP